MDAGVRLTAALAVLLLAGCSSSNDPSSAAAEKDRIGTLVAPMRGVGSAATGKVIVVDNGNGVTLTLNATNLIQGTYRLAFHQDPHCTAARNSIATGPAWAPPDSPKPPGELIPIANAGFAGEIYQSTRIPGVHVDREPSLRGHSIVLHWGSEIDTPFPGMPNNYILCGVFKDYEPGYFESVIR
jgi:Cu/Zn superoxide dismutase